MCELLFRYPHSFQLVTPPEVTALTRTPSTPSSLKRSLSATTTASTSSSRVALGSVSPAAQARASLIPHSTSTPTLPTATSTSPAKRRKMSGQSSPRDQHHTLPAGAHHYDSREEEHPPGLHLQEDGPPTLRVECQRPHTPLRTSEDYPTHPIEREKTDGGFTGHETEDHEDEGDEEFDLERELEKLLQAPLGLASSSSGQREDEQADHHHHDHSSEFLDPPSSHDMSPGSFDMGSASEDAFPLAALPQFIDPDFDGAWTSDVPVPTPPQPAESPMLMSFTSPQDESATTSISHPPLPLPLPLQYLQSTFVQQASPLPPFLTTPFQLPPADVIHLSLEASATPAPAPAPVLPYAQPPTVSVVLLHKPRGSHGQWVPLTSDQRIRVTKGKGKRLRVEIRCSRPFIWSELMLNLMDVSDDEMRPCQEFKICATRSSIKDDGRGATTAMIEVNVVRVIARLQFVVGITSRREGWTWRGCSVPFITHNNGKDRSPRRGRRKKRPVGGDHPDPSGSPQPPLH